MNKNAKQKCISCGNTELSKDEIGINLKQIGEDTKNFYCLDCLATVLDVTTQDILDKITPKMLPVILTILVFYLIKKRKWNTYQLLFFLFVIGILASDLGILA